MTDRISSRTFHESDGVEDWRVLYGRAFACYRTGSFAAGIALVDAIGAVADAVDHHPDVQLRYGDVTVRLVSHDIGDLSARDLDLARRISRIARDLGVPADPTAVQQVNLTIDTLDRTAIMPFWRAALDYRDAGDEDLVDPRGLGAPIWFQQQDEPRPQRNRIHLDVAVPHEQAEARVAAALAAGGRLVTDEHAPSWWVLADAEGNEACIATWVGRWWEE
jgi:4a-hydroxytetrahydrobiopterin dehydratase